MLRDLKPKHKRQDNKQQQIIKPKPIYYYNNQSCKPPANNPNLFVTCCNERVPLTNPPFSVNATQCNVMSTYEFAAFCCTAQFYTTSELVQMAFISLALTVVNIACIWVAATMMFYVKNIAPLPMSLKNQKYTLQGMSMTKFTSMMADTSTNVWKREEELKRFFASFDLMNQDTEGVNNNNNNNKTVVDNNQKSN